MPAENTEVAENKDNAEQAENKKPTTIYYVSDEEQQAQYIKLFKDEGLNAICCDNFIDPHFLSFIEYKAPDKLKFMRIDADLDGALKTGDGSEDSVIAEIFKTAIADEKTTVKSETLKNTEVPAIITTDEYMRRYSEMGRMYGMSDGELLKTVVINTANPIVAKIKELSEEKQKFVARYIYLLALSSFKKLSKEESDELQRCSLNLLFEYAK